MAMFGRHKKLSNRSRRPIVERLEKQPVFSYYGQHRSKQSRRPSQVLNKRIGLRPWWHFVPSIISITAITISLVYMLGLSANPKVISQGNSSLLLHPIGDYQKAAQQQFESSWLNRSKITVNTSAIAGQLKDKFPELADVSITLPLIGRRPVVYILPSPLELVLKTQSGNFVINHQGKAVLDLGRRIPTSSQTLPIVTDQSGLDVKVGQTAIPASYVDFTSTVLQQLRAKQFLVDSIVLPARSFELDVRLRGQLYTIKMNLQNDATQQIGTFLAAEQKLTQSDQIPADYFDVRVPGRIYYK